MARFKKNTYKAVCDLSGAVFNSTEMRMMWSGLFVHKSLWSRKHPQQTLPTIKEDKVPHTPRPEGEPTFLEYGDVTADDL